MRCQGSNNAYNYLMINMIADIYELGDLRGSEATEPQCNRLKLFYFSPWAFNIEIVWDTRASSTQRSISAQTSPRNDPL